MRKRLQYKNRNKVSNLRINIFQCLSTLIKIDRRNTETISKETFIPKRIFFYIFNYLNEVLLNIIIIEISQNEQKQ